MGNTPDRIERGAQLLDEHVTDWEYLIDLDTLDLSDVRFCVLGQVYGDYDIGLSKIDGDAERHPTRYGFLGQGNERYVNLTARWRRYIERRRYERQATA